MTNYLKNLQWNGVSNFVVIPKKWMDDNDVKPRDQVMIETNGDTLTIKPFKG